MECKQCHFYCSDESREDCPRCGTYYTKSDKIKDSIISLINDALIIKWENCGIGSYEYWGAVGTDVRWLPVIQNKEVEIDIQDLELIPRYLRGEKVVEDDHKGYETIQYCATLQRIDGDKATYSVEQD